MRRTYRWRLEIKVLCGDDPVDFQSLPEWARDSIMQLVRNGDTQRNAYLDDSTVNNCQNGSYDCDTCACNGDCPDQGMDGKPSREEVKSDD